MRRFVRNRIAAALERERPALEEFIAERLRLPDGFPYALDAAVVIREVRQFKVAALARADLPPVRIEAQLKAWLANRVVEIRGVWDFGVIDADVKLEAQGTVVPDGTYTITPQSATLSAWWRDIAPPMASQWIARF